VQKAKRLVYDEIAVDRNITRVIIIKIELKAAEKHPPFSAFHPCLSGQTKLDKNK